MPREWKSPGKLPEKKKKMMPELSHEMSVRLSGSRKAEVLLTLSPRPQNDLCMTERRGSPEGRGGHRLAALQVAL